jgi:membrane associated rhomboid family serine protease
MMVEINDWDCFNGCFSLTNNDGMTETEANARELRDRTFSALTLRALAVSTAIIALIVIVDGCVSTLTSIDKMPVAGPLTLLTGVALGRFFWRYWRNSSAELKRLRIESPSLRQTRFAPESAPKPGNATHVMFEPELDTPHGEAHEVSARAKRPILVGLFFGAMCIVLLGYQAFESPSLGLSAPIGGLIWIELVTVWVWLNPVRLSVKGGVLTVKPSLGPPIRISHVEDLAMRGSTLCIRIADLDFASLPSDAVREALIKRAAKTGSHFEFPGRQFTQNEVNQFRAAIGMAAQPPNSTPDFDQLLLAITPRAIVTYTILILNVGVFVAMVLQGSDLWQPTVNQLIEWGANFGPQTASGEWWRTITSVFVHIGLLHLFCNLFVLRDIGPLVERLVGSKLFLIGYLFSGYCGSVASVAWNSFHVSAGASGAVFGLFGMAIGLLLRHRQEIPPDLQRQHRFSAIVFVIYNLYLSLYLKGIDTAAHLGGLAAGFCFGLLVIPVFSIRQRRLDGQRVVPTAIACVVVGIFAFLQFVPQVADVAAVARQLNQHEKHAIEIWNSTNHDLQSETITAHQAATRIRDEVVIPFRKELDRIQSLPHVLREHREWFETIVTVTQLRLNGWNLYADYLDSNNPALRGEYELNEEAVAELTKQWSARNGLETNSNLKSTTSVQYSVELAVFAALKKRFDDAVHFDADTSDPAKAQETANRIEKTLPDLQAARRRFEQRAMHAEGGSVVQTQLMTRYIAALEERWEMQAKYLRNADDELAKQLRRKVRECDQLESVIKLISSSDPEPTE